MPWQHLFWCISPITFFFSCGYRLFSFFGDQTILSVTHKAFFPRFYLHLPLLALHLLPLPSTLLLMLEDLDEEYFTPVWRLLMVLCVSFPNLLIILSNVHGLRRHVKECHIAGLIIPGSHRHGIIGKHGQVPCVPRMYRVYLVVFFGGFFRRMKRRAASVDTWRCSGETGVRK